MIHLDFDESCLRWRYSGRVLERSPDRIQKKFQLHIKFRKKYLTVLNLLKNPQNDRHRPPGVQGSIIVTVTYAEALKVQYDTRYLSRTKVSFEIANG